MNTDEAHMKHLKHNKVPIGQCFLQKLPRNNVTNNTNITNTLVFIEIKEGGASTKFQGNSTPPKICLGVFPKLKIL